MYQQYPSQDTSSQ